MSTATGSKRPDCNPDPAVESPCPFQQVDASGLARVITSLPLAADRVLLPPVGPQPSWSPTPRSARRCRSPRPAASSALSIDGDRRAHARAPGSTCRRSPSPRGRPLIPCTSRSRRSSSRSASRRSRTTASTDDVFSQTLAGRGRRRRSTSASTSAEDAFADGRGLHRAHGDRHGRQARRRHPGRRRHRRSPTDAGPGRPAQGAQLRARTTRRRCSAGCARPSRAPAATSPR